MNKRLVHVAPLQCGTVLAVLYGCLSLFVIPFILLGAMIPNPNGAHPPFPFGLVFAVVIPFLYAFLGFLFGIIGAAVYNLVARMTGGLQFRVVDVPTGTRDALDPLLD